MAQPAPIAKLSMLTTVLGMPGSALPKHLWVCIPFLDLGVSCLSLGRSTAWLEGEPGSSK